MIKKLFKNKLFILALSVLLVAFIIWTAWGNTALELNTVEIASANLPAEFSGFRIAHVSDLHNTEFGEGNAELIGLIKSAKPDMIAITGDIIDNRRTNIAVAIDFAKKATEIAPCYYVAGNHEARDEEVFSELESKLVALGVFVLRDEQVALERGSADMSIVGMDDPAFTLATHEKFSERLGEVHSSEGFTLLLSHRPELFEEYAANGIDLALCGHAHGGQIRFPLLGGIVAPHQGLFPKYDGGLYTDGSTNMVVSRGLGNSLFPFRVNNRPEVILIELEGREK